MGALSMLDPSSYSRPELAVIRHAFLFLVVDFYRSVIDGYVELQFEALEDVDHVVLDSSDLTIKRVEFEDSDELTYELEDYIKDYGSRMTVNLPQCIDRGTLFKVVIKYETSPEARALQWLNTTQTSGKRHPYMFSQCQPIHARSLLPCQDTPNVKFTYDAEVVAASEFTVLMSALRDEHAMPVSGGRKHTFHQRVPIPSYLIAIVVGDLESRRLGPRSMIWAEKEVVDDGAQEFAETEQMLQAAECVCGPYVWEQYNLLVLPPSFPFGGMENPCLTFVTPTLLAGDRSLADVVVHEIIHSWTGNLVTNSNFEHFWLNEGFTVFLERKVTSALEAASGGDQNKIRDFLSLLGLQELNDTVNNVLGAESPLTDLVVNLANVHPDDAFSLVPYEKGSLFLRYLEDLVGGPSIFDIFVRSYLNKFSRKSLTTEDFKAFFEDYFKHNSAIKQIDWHSWLNKPGMPIITPKYDTTMAQECTDLARRWQKTSHAETLSPDDLKTFTVQQTIKFLQELLTMPPLPADKYALMEKLYKLDETGNSEIKMKWLRLGIRAKVDSVIPKALEFVNSQGRMKFIRPIYRDLHAWPAWRDVAINNFLQNEQNYMHVAAFTVRKDLHLP